MPTENNLIADGNRDKDKNVSTNIDKRVKIQESSLTKKKSNRTHQCAGSICRRRRTLSTSKSEDHLMTTDHGMVCTISLFTSEVIFIL